MSLCKCFVINKGFFAFVYSQLNPDASVNDPQTTTAQKTSKSTPASTEQTTANMTTTTAAKTTRRLALIGKYR